MSSRSRVGRPLLRGLSALALVSLLLFVFGDWPGRKSRHAELAYTQVDEISSENGHSFDEVESDGIETSWRQPVVGATSASASILKPADEERLLLVQAESGHAVEGARVACIDAQSNWLDFRSLGLTGTDGILDLGDVRESGIWVAIEHSGYASTRSYLVDDGAWPKTVTLGALSEIRGQVLDWDASLIGRSIEIVAHPHGSQWAHLEGPKQSDKDKGANESNTVLRVAEVEADGTFTVKGCASGTWYYLGIRGDGVIGTFGGVREKAPAEGVEMQAYFVHAGKIRLQGPDGTELPYDIEKVRGFCSIEPPPPGCEWTIYYNDSALWRDWSSTMGSPLWARNEVVVAISSRKPDQLYEHGIGLGLPGEEYRSVPVQLVDVGVKDLPTTIVVTALSPSETGSIHLWLTCSNQQSRSYPVKGDILLIDPLDKTQRHEIDIEGGVEDLVITGIRPGTYAIYFDIHNIAGLSDVVNQHSTSFVQINKEEAVIWEYRMPPVTAVSVQLEESDGAPYVGPVVFNQEFVVDGKVSRAFIDFKRAPYQMYKLDGGRVLVGLPKQRERAHQSEMIEINEETTIDGVLEILMPPNR